MKRLLSSLFLAFLSLSYVAAPADAARLGGGRTSGVQRQAPPPAPAQQTPAQPQQAAAPTNSPAMAAAPAAQPKRSWMGPIAGIAAGLGLAALMSHLGLGAEFGNFLTLLLLGIIAVVAIRFLMRRFGSGASARTAAASGQGLQYAGAGAGAGFPGASAPVERSGPAFGSGGASPSQLAPVEPVASVAPAGALPAGFDAPAFERIAKLIFIRMQAANDAGNLDDLRQFTTPEMFAAFRLDLQDRQGAAQQTDVVQLDAKVVDFAQEAGQQIVSVQFRGLIREVADVPAVPFDEVWHLVKPNDGSREWAIAGIAQTEAAAA